MGETVLKHSSEYEVALEWNVHLILRSVSCLISYYIQ